jgi:hypothetical protein
MEAVEKAPKAKAPKTERFVDLKYVELHDGLFLAGKNLGTKLDPKQITGLTLKWDMQSQELVVAYNGQVSITSTNCKSRVPVNPTDFGIDWVTPGAQPFSRVVTAGSQPMVANVSRTAQVSDPTRGMK